MTLARDQRDPKRQLGQFLTPPALAHELVANLAFTSNDKVLEPGLGDGSFVLPLIERFMVFYKGSSNERMQQVLRHNVYGLELDPIVYQRCLQGISERWGPLPREHNLVCGDFFVHTFLETAHERPLAFNWIIGNPPFGGTIGAHYADELERAYGKRGGEKIKKETYSFFVVCAAEMLASDGHLRFICSDTFLTIPTMRGLRRWLMSLGKIQIKALQVFSEETTYPMVVLDLVRGSATESILVDENTVSLTAMEQTGNFSWRINSHYLQWFQGPRLADYIQGTSGMTIGKNELFVRQIQEKTITEPYAFTFFDDPITVEKERARARLQRLSERQQAQLAVAEAAGETRRNLAVLEREQPETITLPHPDYMPYNKAVKGLVYHPPTHVVYWKDEGDAVYTYKKNGNWYLHGVGGKPFFQREGLTWSLISKRISMRYLPPGYILDSGAPCAFLRPQVASEELYFILAWTLTDIASELLKQVINHTMNIQSKDIERLPYPAWVTPNNKALIVANIKDLLARAVEGESFDRHHPEVRVFDSLFALPEASS